VLDESSQLRKVVEVLLLALHHLQRTVHSEIHNIFHSVFPIAEHKEKHLPD
jgi:hypothetical protein